MTLAPVNKIIPFSLVDGVGSRVSIFFQGCNARCLYCHNPETQKLCANCKECVPFCPVNALSLEQGKILWNSDICINCDKCINVCQYFSSPKIKYMSVEQLYQKIEQSIPFARGITVSGGECMLYASFLEELFSLCKENNLTSLIDTNGTIDLTQHPNLINLCDGVMLDIKEWDKQRFFDIVGYDNKNVVKNLLYLYQCKKIEELRIVCLEKIANAHYILENILYQLKDVNDIKLKLIKFRNHGVKTKLSQYPTPSEKYMDELKLYATGLGFNNVVII